MQKQIQSQPSHLDYFHIDADRDMELTVASVIDDDLGLEEVVDDNMNVTFDETVLDEGVIDSLLREFRVEANEKVDNSLVKVGERFQGDEALGKEVTQNLEKPVVYPKVVWPLPKKRYQLMTASDMGFVLRSQLHQLGAVNPWNDDFYYQVVLARKGNYNGAGFPVAKSSNQSDPFRNMDGTAILPPGTLGRLRAASLKKPRSLLDLNFESVDEAELPNLSALPPKKNGMMAHMALSFVIEEGLRVVAAQR